MAGEQNMIRIYQMGGDIHAATAAATMGIEYEDFVEYQHDDTPLCEVIDRFVGAQTWLNQQEGKKSSFTIKQFFKAKRQQAKAINFGFLYGMGWRTFMTYAKTDYGVEFTESEAKEVRKTFFRKYPRLQTWHEVTRQIVHERGYVRALHGAIRRLPSVASNDEAMVALAERNAINSPVQRFASDLGLIALQRICRDMPSDVLKPVAFIHDALIFLVPEDRAEEMAGYVKWYMETPPLEEWFGIKPPLPIVADAEIGDSLAEMEEVEGITSTQPDWYDEYADAA
jgi:DNA polymerase I-like protein with 3'-5' exonuclease and polymerase domains